MNEVEKDFYQQEVAPRAKQGIACLQLVFLYDVPFKEQGVPVIIGSFGASAFLIFGAIESPLAQPRNLVGGHLIGAFVGTIICNLFYTLPHFESVEQQQTVRWVAAATAVAITLLCTQVTKTVHPPAGATALLAVVQDNIVKLNWLYIAVILVSVLIQLGIALIINNIERRYPLYWWTPNASPAPAKDITSERVLPKTETSSQTLDDTYNAVASESYEARLFMVPGRPILMPKNILSEEEEHVLMGIQEKLDRHWQA
ncbi:HPP family-domain-containing protein [Spinellus fusiger]|nr:HPP family-domain-containing protein [Spinellus fusiger]